VVHPQSIVHSMVEYRDGSWIAQLAANDMVMPIQYALAFPERWENSFERLEPRDLGTLDFQPVPPRLTRAVELARAALESGGSAPAVLNAANEEGVRAFLAGKIPFPRILHLVEEVLDAHQSEPVASLEAAWHWNSWGRSRAARALAS